MLYKTSQPFYYRSKFLKKVHKNYFIVEFSMNNKNIFKITLKVYFENLCQMLVTRVNINELLYKYSGFKLLYDLT